MSTEPGKMMAAAWYDRQGPAADVLRVGELPVPRPSDGEVRVAVALDQPDAAAAIRRHAPAGVDRVVVVALSDNGDLDASVVANDAVIAVYSSRSDRIDLPFLPLLFANVTLRLLGSDDFPVQAKHQAARDLTAAAGSSSASLANVPSRPAASPSAAW